jgi:hypothetical protein
MSLQFPEINSQWVSASQTRNYMLGDTLLDWLNLYGDQKGFRRDSDLLSFGKYIMERGDEFEKYVMSNIRSRFPESVVELQRTHEFQRSRGKPDYSGLYSKTLSLMKAGTPIIYQGFLINPDNQTYGYPDLLVRSDFINQLFTNSVITDKKARKGCCFSPDWHYVVVDIKFTRLNLRMDGKTLLNTGSMLPYKAQVYIYNQALGVAQNLVPGKAYFIGRGWKCGKDSGNTPFDKCARVEFYDTDDSISTDSTNAIEWYRRVKTIGESWEVLPVPWGSMLYPNMNNLSDYPWNNAKRDIARRVYEITSLWMCGFALRERCFARGIYNWMSREFNPQELGVPGKWCGLVQRIIDINRPDSNLTYDFDVAKSDILRDLSVTHTPVFVDFETVTGINRVEHCNPTLLFLIGAGTEIDDWKFTSLLSQTLDQNGQSLIVADFLKYLHSLHQLYNKPVLLVHWSNAEPNTFSTLHVLPEWCKWFDLLEHAKDSKLVVNGCLEYGLKAVSAGLAKWNLIPDRYSTSDITGGTGAMIAAFESYSKEKPNEHPHMKSTIRYNEIDCRVLSDIWRFLSNDNMICE